MPRHRSSSRLPSPALSRPVLGAGLLAALCGFAAAANEPMPERAPGAGEAIALPSPGCADPIDPRQDPDYSDIHGIDLLLTMPVGAPGPALRNYRVTLPRPSDYDPEQLHGLIFNSHGCGGSHQTSFRNVANHLADHFDLPTITIGTDANGNCFDLNVNGADFPYFQALKAQVLSDYCVDERNVFFLGRSSGSFASQYFGCHNHAGAIIGELGGIATGHGPPGTEACGPIPTLLGSALQDTTVPWNTFGIAARDWWIGNNGCQSSHQPHPEANQEVCGRNPQLSACSCVVYDGCVAEFVQCTWNGSHQDTALNQQNMGWWLGTHANSTPAGDDEIFRSGFEL